MKYILMLFMILTSAVFAEKIQLCPLIEDKDFALERMLQIECCVQNIDNIANFTEPHICEALKYEVMLIKYCLGHPIETNDLYQ
jgi:hypothetical protein